jgi:NAD(P)H-dependent flavin oxidoreductase YrpB (nitropropane dioxygenase family)
VKTAITELFGIQHPIIQGGMHYVGFAELAAAVSNAGGLGIITGLTQRTPELLAKEIARCHDMTDKPFGVNLTFLPSFSAPPYPEYIAAITEGGIKIVETAGRSPEQYMPALKAVGIKVIGAGRRIRSGWVQRCQVYPEDGAGVCSRLCIQRSHSRAFFQPKSGDCRLIVNRRGIRPPIGAQG